MLQDAGFDDVELVTESGFNSSPETRGVLVRASKPGHGRLTRKEQPMDDSFLNVAMPVAEQKLPEDKVELVLRRALELGAKKAKLIDPQTVIVEEWVRWKCLYGCPMYAKDAFHPPLAPDAESTRKVMKEYSKALLINGPNGNQLSDIVLKLEGEAYFMGYYKAFAFAAFGTTPGST